MFHNIRDLLDIIIKIIIIISFIKRHPRHKRGNHKKNKKTMITHVVKLRIYIIPQKWKKENPPHSKEKTWRVVNPIIIIPHKTKKSQLNLR